MTADSQAEPTLRTPQGFCLFVAAITASNLGAQAADGAVANFTPGKVKLLHTGGVAPNGSYADLGRLTCARARRDAQPVSLVVV